MNILIITHYFHPEPIIAAFRINAFARYMRQAGHQVTVIADGKHSESISWEGCDVHYVTDPIFPSFSTRSYLEKLSRLAPRHILASLLYRLTLHPSYLEEFKFTRLAKKIIKEKKIDLLLTTGALNLGTNLTGLRLKQCFPSLYWIADYRDEVRLPSARRWDINWFMLPHHRRRVQRIYDRSDLLLSVSAPIVDMIRRASAHGNVLEIRNGYDYPEATGCNFQPHFTMSYIGHFYHGITPDNWFRAFAELLSENRIPSDSKIRIIGNPQPVNVPDAIRNNVEILPTVSHDEAVRISIHETDVLVMVYSKRAGRRGVYSGKLLDYLATNKPIISIYDPTDVPGELLAETRAGFAVDEDDIPAIKNAILECHRLWAERRVLPRDWEKIRQHHRRHQVGLLLDYLRRTTTLR